MKSKLLLKTDKQPSIFNLKKRMNFAILIAFFMLLQTGFAQVTISPWQMNKGGGIIN